MSRMTKAGVDAVASEIVEGLAELLARLHTSRKPVLRRVRHLLEAVYAQEYLGIANSQVPLNSHRFWTLSDISIIEPILKALIADSVGESSDEQIKAKFARYEIDEGD